MEKLCITDTYKLQQALGASTEWPPNLDDCGIAVFYPAPAIIRDTPVYDSTPVRNLRKYYRRASLIRTELKGHLST